jgi:hypothetical protein
VGQPYLTTRVVRAAEPKEPHSPGAREVGLNAIGPIVDLGQLEDGATRSQPRPNSEDEVTNLIRYGCPLTLIIALPDVALDVGDSVSCELARCIQVVGHSIAVL